MGKPDYLTEWEFFVWRHRGFGNLLMHFISTSLFVIGVILFFITFDWPYLIAIPLSQLIGFSGHYFFEEGGVRSRDFISVMTLVYLFKIYALIFVGKYSDSLKAVGKKVKAKNKGSLEINQLQGKLFYGH